MENTILQETIRLLEKDEHGLYIYASNYEECKTEIEAAEMSHLSHHHPHH